MLKLVRYTNFVLIIIIIYKNTKLKGAIIDNIPTLIHIVCCVGTAVLFELAKIILHVKSPTFRAAKLKGFMVII